MNNKTCLQSFEIILLRWVSEAKTVSEIAKIEGRDREEIHSLLNGVVTTLGAQSLRDAIEIAKFNKIL